MHRTVEVERAQTSPRPALRFENAARPGREPPSLAAGPPPFSAIASNVDGPRLTDAGHHATAPPCPWETSRVRHARTVTARARGIEAKGVRCLETRQDAVLRPSPTTGDGTSRQQPPGGSHDDNPRKDHGASHVRMATYVSGRAARRLDIKPAHLLQRSGADGPRPLFWTHHHEPRVRHTA